MTYIKVSSEIVRRIANKSFKNPAIYFTGNSPSVFNQSCCPYPITDWNPNIESVDMNKVLTCVAGDPKTKKLKIKLNPINFSDPLNIFYRLEDKDYPFFTGYFYYTRNKKTDPEWEIQGKVYLYRYEESSWNNFWAKGTFFYYFVYRTNRSVLNSIPENLPKDVLKTWKTQIQLFPFQRDVVYGTLMGDATISVSQGDSSNIMKWEQAADKRDYILHLAVVFNNFYGTGPSERLNHQKKNNGWACNEVKTDTGFKKVYTRFKAVSFKTYKLDFFEDVFYTFYKIQKTRNEITGNICTRGRKILPHNFKQIVNYVVLAYWFMDDGSFKPYPTKAGIRHAYYLNTQNFTEKENNRICKILNEKFQIGTTVSCDTEYFRIYFGRGNLSAQWLEQNIIKHVHEYFHYKLDPVFLNDYLINKN